MGSGATPQLVAPPDPPGRRRADRQLQVDYFDLPILEYRPYRAFSANQSSTVVFQLFAGADVPYGDSVGRSDRRPATQSAHRLVGRPAHDLRLEVLLAMSKAGGEAPLRANWPDQNSLGRPRSAQIVLLEQLALKRKAVPHESEAPPAGEQANR